MNQNDVNKYLALLKKYNFSYKHTDILKLITDPDRILEISSGMASPVGVIYRSRFNTLVVDLTEDVDGNVFPYERLIKTAPGNSVVIIPSYQGKYVLIKQFRHALGDYQIAFPRGYGEPDISIEENTLKEVREELRACAYDIRKIGTTVADSGICGEKVNIVTCNIDAPSVDGVYEGIREFLFYTESQLADAVRQGIIDDGFTLAATALLLSSHQF